MAVRRGGTAMTAALILAGQVYLWAGAAVAALFLTWGIGRVEPHARGSYLFRPLLVPGCVLIWPLVLWRWRALEQGRDAGCARHRPPRVAQVRIGVALAVLVPLILGLGLVIRQDGPRERPPALLEAAQ
ncbi:MAG: hypothetical protein KDA73_01015 [Rhodobacteraceae bacterium]|nr:hypothetical protein [Paracoccaceae bacterium]